MNLNNLYGQTQVLGKATETPKSTTENGLFNYALPYNQGDFISYSPLIQFKDVSNCVYFNLSDNNMDFTCNMNPDQSIPLTDENHAVVDLSNNYCYVREMCRNKAYADSIMNLDKTHATTNTQYLDTITNTNMQILNIANFSVGIVVMLIMIFNYSKT